MWRKVERLVKELVDGLGTEVYFEDMNLDLLRRLEQHMRDNGNVDNTRHKKFKLLGEYYAHAMLEGKAPMPNPFKSYKIAVSPVKKDKLTEKEIKIIEELQLPPGKAADARDLFLFSYYTKGQRFETCVTARRDQVVNGRIYFRTNKGRDYISVKIHGRLQAIIDRFAGDGELLFPFLDEVPEDPAEYLSAIGTQNTLFNKYLKIVAALAGIKIPLTFHIARHSFAYQLKKVSENVNVIQDALGHSDQRTTQIYLKALEDDRLDGEMEKLYGS
jgi:integrase